MAEPGREHGEGRAEATVCPGGEAIELLSRWRAVDSGLRRINERLLAKVRDDVGLPVSLLQVVCFLAERPQQSAPMRDLAGLLGFSTAGTTGVVDRLVEAGLVERRPSCTDRRVTYASLTEQGCHTATAAVVTMAAAVNTHVIDTLGAEQFTALEDTVRRLDSTAPADADGTDSGCATAALR